MNPTEDQGTRINLKNLQHKIDNSIIIKSVMNTIKFPKVSNIRMRQLKELFYKVCNRLIKKLHQSKVINCLQSYQTQIY